MKAIVFDDEEVWRNAITAAVERLGLEVRPVDHPQTAIDLLKGDRAVGYLFVDWFVQGKGRQLSATSEDVLKMAAKHRPDVVLVVITGAFEDKTFKTWQRQLRISDKEVFRRMKDWRPFDIVFKDEIADFHSDSALRKDLADGLSRLTQRLRCPDDPERDLLQAGQRRHRPDKMPHAKDWSACTWRGQRFEFNAVQAEVVKLLYEAMLEEFPRWVTKREIYDHLEKVGLKRASGLKDWKVRDVFKRHKAWSAFILVNEESQEGRYKLAYT